MDIRLADQSDLDVIMDIYDIARQTMRDNGNHFQWINGYPSRDIVESDIARRVSYVIVGGDGLVHAVFMFSVEEDPAYALIEEGAWLDDEPYGVIHRIASDGHVRGVVPMVVDFCTGAIGSIRIDTHADNAIMHHILGREGFKRCGIVYCHDGSPRVAYQLVL